MNILADASLPGLYEAFPAPFKLSVYHTPDELIHLLPQQEVLLCRSTLKVDASLLKKHALQYVGTASSGTDHFDIPWLQSQGIRILDAKGCNAKAVADYVLSSIAFLKTQGHLLGKKIGIIGLGKVGIEVQTRLQSLDFEITAYDPLKKAPFQSAPIEALYEVDLLCVHAELHKQPPFPSFNLINQHFMTHLKKGCIILNAARGGIVNEEALLTMPDIQYCTDVFLNEPQVDTRIIEKALLCTPHIAGHSLEAKYRAVSMISEKLHQLAHLPLPSFAKPQNVQIPQWDHEMNWEKNILRFYNPHEETLALKKASSKKEAFLNIRPQHVRHDFSLSVAKNLPITLQNLLGKHS